MTKHISIIAAILFAAAPALATEPEHDHTDHQSHAADENHAHDHEDHGDHDHSGDNGEDSSEASGAPLFHTPEIHAALEAGGEPVVADMLGVVCDFCAKAMNKTFGKREEVAAVHVDLDTKTLNLVFKPEMTLTDDVIHSLVKKSGYKAAAIRRGEAALKGMDHASDAS